MKWLKYLTRREKNEFILITILNAIGFFGGIVLFIIGFYSGICAIILPFIYLTNIDSAKALADVRKNNYHGR